MKTKIKVKAVISEAALEANRKLKEANEEMKKKVNDLVKNLHVKAEGIVKEICLARGINIYEMSSEEIQKRFEHRYYEDVLTHKATMLNSEILLDGKVILKIITEPSPETGKWSAKFIHGEELSNAE
ncbi:MAG TPA: hypothetical protein VHO03_16560 [Ignavibacteriales bacterium]|nr:hypothetical protein [Ignavibacteriales bacterium]